MRTFDFYLGNSVKKLKMEFSIAEQDKGPSLFVASDINDIYLVCFVQKSKSREDRWVFAKTSILALIKLIKNELTLQEALSFVEDKITFYVFENGFNGYGHYKTKIDSLDPDMFSFDKRKMKYEDMKGRTKVEELDKQIKDLYLRFFLGETIY